MSEIDLTIKKPIPEWGKELRDKLLTCLENISEQIQTGNTNISQQINEVKTKINEDIQRIDETASEAKRLATENAAAIKTLKTELFTMNRKCNGLQADNQKLVKQCDDLDSYSRRDNLVFRGLKEDSNDDDEESSCIRALRSCFTNTLNINKTIVDKMVFVRVHRLGPKPVGPIKFSRPIIARFHDYNMRKLVWSKRYDIPHNTISMSENYANNIEHRRRLLYPVVKRAKESKQFGKSYLKGDSLILDDKKFVVNENLNDLPTELHPRQFGWKSNQEHIIFGGIHSTYCFLSNYYSDSITYKDVQHDTLEHCYQFQKAERYGDTSAADKILCARSPSDAKYYGSKVQGFLSEDWDSVKGDILLELLRCKFSPATNNARLLQQTTGKSLAEAGRSRTFAIGLSLNDKNIFDKSKWAKDGNLLGRTLMKVRDELNDN